MTLLQLAAQTSVYIIKDHHMLTACNRHSHFKAEVYACLLETISTQLTR